MEGLQILIPLAPFLMVAALVLVPRYYRNKERQEMQATVRAAIDKGQPLPPEMIEAMSKDVPARVKSPRNDLRAGVVWLAVGLGVAAFGYAVGWEEREAVAPILGLACIPAFIGLALIALGLIGPKDNPSSRATI